MAWFKISNTEYDEELLLSKYRKLFNTYLEKMMKKFDVKMNNVILVGDCNRKNIWRLDLFPKYKENRDKTDDGRDMINPKIFPIIYEEIIPKLLKKGVQYVCHDKLEADDIIYIITQKISNDVIVLTNDNDYLQMISNRIDVVNLPSFKSIRNRCLNCPKKDLMLKVLAGDPSDNIPNLFGKKQAIKIINEGLDKIENYVRTNDMYDRFMSNLMLIDMNRIPNELKDDIVIIEKGNHS